MKLTNGGLLIQQGGMCIDSDGSCSTTGPGSLRVGHRGIYGSNSSNWNIYLLPDNEGGVSIGFPTDTTPAHKLYVNGWVDATAVLIRGGSDLAEPFLIHFEGEVLPGMVVAIDPEHRGDLRLAGQAYDRTVAGCISGAGDVYCYQCCSSLYLFQWQEFHPERLAGWIARSCDPALMFPNRSGQPVPEVLAVLEFQRFFKSRVPVI